MSLKALALKEEGTHPPAEGVLSRFAEVRAIRSIADVEKVKKERPDIIFMDLDMPHLSADQVLQVLRRSPRPGPLLICFDSKLQPTRLVQQFASLAKIRPGHARRSRNLSQVVRLLGISQEVLGRILNVSARTAHRWLKGARPRPKPELGKLLEIVSLLEQTLHDGGSLRNYLHYPNPNLGGEKPLDMLIRGEFDRVAADLQAAQEGVYA